MKLPTRITLISALAIAAGLALLDPAAAPGGPGDTPNRLFATLNGDNERPGPGDPDGAGSATIDLRRQARQVCHQITWKNIQNPNAGHIHAGRSNRAGPIKVLLFSGNRVGGSSGCTNGVSRNLIDAIKAEPGRFYVNIHNGQFPNGAIRGQLRQHP